MIYHFNQMIDIKPEYKDIPISEYLTIQTNKNMLTLYLGLLQRLLLEIKRDIESTSTTVNNAGLNRISLEITKLENIKQTETVLELIRLYNILFEKVQFYFKDYHSDVRKAYVMDSFQQVRSRLIEALMQDENYNINFRF